MNYLIVKVRPYPLIGYDLTVLCWFTITTITITTTTITTITTTTITTTTITTITITTITTTTITTTTITTTTIITISYNLFVCSFPGLDILSIFREFLAYFPIREFLYFRSGVNEISALLGCETTSHPQRTNKSSPPPDCTSNIGSSTQIL